MTKTESHTFSKHILLDDSRMAELKAILVKHCDRLSIQVQTIQGASIEFDSYDELMKYENFNTGRIKKLELYGYSDCPRFKRFSITFCAGHQNNYAVECVGNFNQEDEAIVFYNEIEQFVEKSTYAHTSAIIGHWISILSIYVAVFYLFHLFVKDPPLISFVAVSVVAMILCDIFLHLVWDKLFPMVSFSWGEASTYYKHLETIRHGLFWGVVVAIGIGILVNFISSYILK